MTEKEIVELQRSGDTRYLMQVGMFIHAYEGAAFAMARLTGYKVRLVHRKTGDIRMLGFNASQMESVWELMRKAGIILNEKGEKLWAFEGGDTTEDSGLITQPKPRKEKVVEAQTTAAVENTLADEVLAYNLAASTPMEAMLFLSDLQRRYGKQ